LAEDLVCGCGCCYCCCCCCRIVVIVVLSLSSLSHCHCHCRVVTVSSLSSSSLLHCHCHCHIVAVSSLSLHHCHVVSCCHYCRINIVVAVSLSLSLCHCCHHCVIVVIVAVSLSLSLCRYRCCVIAVSSPSHHCHVVSCHHRRHRRVVHTGVLDQGRVQAGHIASPGMLQPWLVSTGNEGQVECTYLLENTDGQTDKSGHGKNLNLRHRRHFSCCCCCCCCCHHHCQTEGEGQVKTRRKGSKRVGHTYFLESTDGRTSVGPTCVSSRGVVS